MGIEKLQQSLLTSLLKFNITSKEQDQALERVWTIQWKCQSTRRVHAKECKEMPCWLPYKNFVLTLQSKRQIKQEKDANNQDGQKHQKSKAIPIP